MKSAGTTGERSFERHLARLLLTLAVALAPARRRTGLAEQWEADLAGADELGLSPASVAAGALRTSLHPTLWKDAPLLPIGPLAIALRHLHGPDATARALPVALVLLVVLLAGVGLLVGG